MALNDWKTGKTTHNNNGIAKSSIAMMIGTIIARATGLLRTWTMAYALGTTVTASAYQVANNLPNMIYETIAGGMISASFLPVLMMTMRENDEQNASRYASCILNASCIALSAASIVGVVFSEQIVMTQTFTDPDGSVARQAVIMFRLFSIQILFYGISGIVQGILNANKKYFVTAVAPAVNNVVTMLSLIAYSIVLQKDSSLAIIVLSIGTTLGVASQFAVQIPSLMRTGYTWIPAIKATRREIAETLNIAAPTMLFVIASVIGNSCRNAFSLGVSDSGPSVIAYAWLWFQLPYGVVAVSLSRTMFTEMSDAVASHNRRMFASNVTRGVRATILIMLPMSACLIAIPYPLAMVFSSGSISTDSISSMASLIRIWGVALPFYAVMMYSYNAFAAIRRFWVFSLPCSALIALQIALYAILPGFIGLDGIAVADLVCYITSSITSMVLLKREESLIDASPRKPEEDDSCESFIEDTRNGNKKWLLTDLFPMIVLSIISMMLMSIVQGTIPEPSNAVSGIIVSLVCGAIGLSFCLIGAIALDVSGIREIIAHTMRRFSVDDNNQ